MTVVADAGIVSEANQEPSQGEPAPDPKMMVADARSGTQVAAGVCVKQIQQKAGISQSTASQFMAVLQRAGLVECTRIGQWTYYRRNDGRIVMLPELLRTTL